MDGLAAIPGPLLLAMSLGALAAGPLLFHLARGRAALLRGLDGFVLAAITGIVVLHILPHTVREVGWPAAAIVLAGLFLPTLAERAEARLARTAHAVTLALALLGVGLHAFGDGMALAENFRAHGFRMLPAAVILHRIPDGLMVWWLVRPLHGRGTALRTLVLMMAATVAGYFAGKALFMTLSPVGVGVFEAVVAGSLLHVIFHHHHPMQRESELCLPGPQWASGLGALAAVAGILFLGPASEAGGEGFAMNRVFSTFVLLARESAPALVIAYVFSGFVETFLPRAGMAWLKKGTTLTQAAKGMIFGLPLPVCSCGVVPLYRALVLKGTPMAAAAAFFVATPELGLDALLISLPLLGWEYTGLRLAAAVFVALAIGMIMGRVATVLPGSERATAIPELEAPAGGTAARLRQALRLGLKGAVDDTLPWIVLGLALASLAEPFLGAVPISRMAPDLQVVVLAFIGMPLYVCASGATPLAAMLVHGGLAPGAALAFLLTGPATNATTFGVLAKLHGKRPALLFGLAVSGLAIVSGLIVNRLFDPATLPPFLTGVSETGGERVKHAFLAVLALLFTASLLRRGPRGIIADVVSFDDGLGHGPREGGEGGEKDVVGCCGDCGHGE